MSYPIKELLQYSIGIDIGTSSITAVIIDPNGVIKDRITKYNESVIKKREFDSLQCADKMVRVGQNCLEELLEKNREKEVLGIGVSNQMHGIVYVNADGDSVYPFINWQDKRGEERQAGRTYTEDILRKTGYLVPTGYGVVSHYYNMKNNEVPKSAHRLMDIGSYFVSKLIDNSVETMHPSNAHAWGCYDIAKKNFDLSALSNLEIDLSLLPSVVDSILKIGEYKNIPVYNAMGDNQMGFLGAVGTKRNEVLVNLGTSAQLSFLSDISFIEGFEERPFIGDKNLQVASSLCGGKTIDLWIGFISDIIALVMEETNSTQNKQKIFTLLKSIKRSESDVKASPYFYGLRSDANKLASISNISHSNFTFEDISIALIEGIIDELYTSWERVPEKEKKAQTTLCVTGGAAQIPLVVSIIKNKFRELEVLHIPDREDAAIGAAKAVFVARSDIY